MSWAQKLNACGLGGASAGMALAAISKSCSTDMDGPTGWPPEAIAAAAATGAATAAAASGAGSAAALTGGWVKQ